MNKREFQAKLYNLLRGLPQAEIAESIDFYSELIDDRIEEGMSEWAAVASVGSPEQVASKILCEIPMARLVKERVKPGRQLRVWEIILIVLGSPLWLALLISAFAVVLSLYVVMWSLAIVLYSSVIAFMAGSLFGIFYTPFALANGGVGTALFTLGAGIASIGLTIYTYYASIYVTRAFTSLSKMAYIGIKSSLVRKGERI